MKPQSAKAKGRRLQKDVRDQLLSNAPTLEPDDIRSTSMGAGGEDLLLSPAARRKYPFSFECKNTERLNIWDAIGQAEANAGQHVPAVVFKRNKSQIYVALPFSAFLNLVGGTSEG